MTPSFVARAKQITVGHKTNTEGTQTYDNVARYREYSHDARRETRRQEEEGMGGERGWLEAAALRSCYTSERSRGPRHIYWDLVNDSARIIYVIW